MWVAMLERAGRASLLWLMSWHSASCRHAAAARGRQPSMPPPPTLIARSNNSTASCAASSYAQQPSHSQHMFTDNVITREDDDADHRTSLPSSMGDIWHARAATHRDVQGLCRGEQAACHFWALLQVAGAHRLYTSMVMIRFRRQISARNVTVHVLVPCLRMGVCIGRCGGRLD